MTVAPEEKAKPKRRRCDGCGKLFPPEEISHGPDPFLHDVHGDDTPCWLCGVCWQERADDI